MKGTERILGISLGGALALAVVYLAVDRLAIAPWSQASAAEAKKLSDLDQARRRNQARGALEVRLRQVTVRTLGSDPLVVSEQVRARLADLVGRSGLGKEHWSLGSMKPSLLPKSPLDKQTGWRINVRGPLNQIVNFLYSLETEPYVHRLENLRLTPQADKVALEVNFLTLALASPVGKPPATMPAGAPGGDIGKRPGEYDLIAQRDLFRPYVQAKPGELMVRSAPSNPPEPRQDDPSPDGRYQIVDLSTYAGMAEVGVRDSSSDRIQRYKLGQALGGGSIVMIDYRPLPYPDHPQLISQSRVILQIGAEFYAVERGRTLAQKYRLGRQDLPQELKQTPGAATAPSADSYPKQESGRG